MNKRCDKDVLFEGIHGVRVASITDHITAFSVGDQSMAGTNNSGDTDAGETIHPWLEELDADNSLITTLEVNRPTQWYIASISGQGTDQQGSKEKSKHRSWDTRIVSFFFLTADWLVKSGGFSSIVKKQENLNNYNRFHLVKMRSTQHNRVCV